MKINPKTGSKPELKPSSDIESKPIENKEDVFQKEITTSIGGTSRRTEGKYNVEHFIDELKDRRSILHKLFGFLTEDIDAQALNENFLGVKKFFEQYAEFGIKIPDEILKNFERSGSDAPLLGHSAYLTEEQAKELKKLAYEGESKIQKKQLGQREIDYGEFQIQEIATEVGSHLTKEDLLNFLKTSTSLKRMETKPKDRLVLKGSDLKQPKLLQEKLQFVRENNLKLNINLENKAEIEAMILFLKNKENADLLGNIEVFQLPDIHNENVDKVNELLNVLNLLKLPNLNSLFFGTIFVDFNLPQFPNLATLSFGDLKTSINLPQMPNLAFLSFGYITQPLTLPQFPNLATLSFGDIWADLNLPLFPNLATLSFGKVNATLNLPPFPNQVQIKYGS